MRHRGRKVGLPRTCSPPMCPDLTESPRRLFRRWREADASDASFRLPDRLAILRALLHAEAISLAALNAPLAAVRGTTPLGLAAWLDAPAMVRILLCECPGLVSVNGVDTSGATALHCKCPVLS